MPISDAIVLVHVYDQVELLELFAAWYTKLGVRRIVIQDMGSTDGSQELLEQLSQDFPLDWYPLDDLNLLNHVGGNTGDNMATMVRDRYAPEWIIMCDADEFLCFDEGGLSELLHSAQEKSITSLTIPCFNMTGPPPRSDEQALLSLTTRVVRPYQETLEQQLSRQIPVPLIFVKHMPKSIVLASAFSSYKPGSHGANVASGREQMVTSAHFKHYPMRAYSKFQQKVANVEQFLALNRHLPEWWGWHWRRWIDLARNGDLKAEYDRQFLNKADQVRFVMDGTCQVDESVALWVTMRGSSSRGFERHGLSPDEARTVRFAVLDAENSSLRERLGHLADRAAHFEREVAAFRDGCTERDKIILNQQSRLTEALTEAAAFRDGCTERDEIILNQQSRLAEALTETGAFRGGCAERDEIIKIQQSRLDDALRETAAFRDGCTERDREIVALRHLVPALRAPQRQ